MYISSGYGKDSGSRHALNKSPKEERCKIRGSGCEQRGNAERRGGKDDHAFSPDAVRDLPDQGRSHRHPQRGGGHRHADHDLAGVKNVREQGKDGLRRK